MPDTEDVWLTAGVPTPFAKVDGPLAGHDAVELSRAIVSICADDGQGSVLLLEAA